MIKDNILKPLPIRVHLAFWTVYFGWITAVNVYRYGWGHLVVMFFVAIVMLVISYVNRAWLRHMLFKKLIARHVLTLIAYFLLTALLVFLTLYQFPTSLSRKILKNPELFRFADFAIDALTFYLSFALKGMMILAAEILYNLTVGLFRHLGLMRAESLASSKVRLFRNWVTHFMGNLTQSLIRLVRRSPSALTRFDVFLKLETYGIRQLSGRDTILGRLEDEIHYLQQLMNLYDERQILLRIDVSDPSIPILPMLLLSVYKNMVKHGDFSNLDRPAVLTVCADDQKLMVSSANKVAEQSAWIFQSGGTGIEQLIRLLRMEYGNAFSLTKHTTNGIFYLKLEINFRHGYNKTNIEAREET
ncbi:hypothetical protein ACR78Z_01795 [Sphingobacterium thalpophilum]|uniref:hypothetical protein n=1 Tax=Sphingobacterium thalpophilum TaxID=259 RepID=UPI003DA36D72